jgi:hypothetical protein
VQGITEHAPKNSMPNVNYTRILKHTNYAKMSKLCEEFEIVGNFI